MKKEDKKKLKSYLKSTKGNAQSQVISWVLVLFLVGVLGGGLAYSLATMMDAIDEGNATTFIMAVFEVLQLIPTWLKVIMITGFAIAIGLLGIVAYKLYQSQGFSNTGGL